MKNKDSQATACNGVPIFDGYGGIMTADDAARLEEMWESSENYKNNNTSISDESSRVPLDQQILSASTHASKSQPTDKSPVPER